ncbi:MAG: hypothetical protein K2X99_00295, partial [Gemmatimonadaceae bacterium]|nr:hypothetical protein [Gemmatimonadaceae bacterium]
MVQAHEMVMASPGDATHQVMGDFVGHWLPGVALLFWAFVWLRRLRANAGANTPQPLESSLPIIVVKILVGVIGIAVHVPPAHWPEMSRAMAWQHQSMFGPIALSGAVDLLERRGHVGPRATHTALLFAFAIIVVL